MWKPRGRRQRPTDQTVSLGNGVTLTKVADQASGGYDWIFEHTQDEPIAVVLTLDEDGHRKATVTEYVV